MIEKYAWETISTSGTVEIGASMLDFGRAQLAQMQAHVKDLAAYRQRKISTYIAWSAGELKEFQAKVVEDAKACIPRDGFEVDAVITGNSPIKVREKK